MRVLIATILTLGCMALTARAGEIVIDLGTVTIPDDADVQADLMAWVDYEIPTETPKTLAEYKTGFRLLCRKILLHRIKQYIDDTRVREIREAAQSAAEAVESRSVFVEGD